MAAGEEKSGDFYKVLGLKKECSETELRNAYKKLAMRWHPDRCSASGNSKFLEEAKEKFQEIQAAYSVLSDTNKRFLYDVGIYDSDDDHSGMGDFLGEMAQMMTQTKPNGNGQESFEELQQLFMEMFQPDLDLGLQGRSMPKPISDPRATNGLDRTWSPASASPITPLCDGINGNNKRGSSGLSLSKANLDELGLTGFCFGSNGAAESTKTRGNGGSSRSKRRSGRKQKVSSKHDVSSRDTEISI